MTDRRPFDPERDGPLLSGYADGELSAAERELVESWLAMDDRARKELDRIVQMKAFTDHLALVPAPEESWEEFHKRMHHRAERGLGWTLLVAGASVVGIYLALRVLLVVMALAIPVVIRLGLLVAAAGLVILLISALRERLFTRKRDRYDDVRR
jgi:anti-sigma factor RsiW